MSEGGMRADAVTGDEPDGAMADEFNVLPTWTLEAVRDLGPEHAVPAACRGSASPAALHWLARTCRLQPGQLLVDVGGGMGGPARFAEQEYGVRPLVIDPSPGAVRAAEALFGRGGLSGLVASGNDLPLADGTADVVWCLGVLCTMTDRRPLLRELRRLLPAGGSLGLLVFEADEPHPDGAPEGNDFPDLHEVATLLHQAGFSSVDSFDSVESVELAHLPPPPPAWTDREREVQEWLEREHGGDPRYTAAQDQSRRIARLIHDGIVRGRLIHASAREPMS